MKQLLLLLILFVISCAKNNKLTELNLTYVKPPLNAPAIISYKKEMVNNAFVADGITVKYHEMASGSQQTTAMAGKSIDIATVLGGTSAIVALANGADLKIVSMFSRAPSAFTLVAMTNSDISLSNFKGKSFAGPKGTVLHQLLASVLKEQGLTFDDITFLSMNLSEALTSLIKGDIDVAMLAGATVEIAQQQGGTIIIDGTDHVDGSTVIATRGDFLKKHPNVVKKYLEVQEQSLRYLMDNPEESYTLIAEELGLSTEQVANILPAYNFKQGVSEEDIANLNKTQDFLFDAELIPQKTDISSAIHQVL